MKTVAIPIENKVREFQGKLWLGLNLIERGYEVIIGPSYETKKTLEISKPDVYITKDVGDSKPQIEFLKEIRSAGINVCGLDPEAGVNSSNPGLSFRKMDVVDYMDAYFAWGSEPANNIKRHYENDIPIYITGNPRFDLLVSPLRSIHNKRAKEIRSEYGDYILINTNFSIANPFDWETKCKNVRETININERHINMSRILYTFFETIFYLKSKNLNPDIIIRPHPGEDHTLYEKAFNNCEGVHVRHSGSVHPWIAGAEAVIHHDCTTGIESALMQTPVLSYQPIKHEWHEKKLSQKVSKEVFNQDELYEWVSKYTTNDERYELSRKQKDDLRPYFPNIDELSAPKICNVIEKLECSDKKDYGSINLDMADKIERRIKSSTFSEQIIFVYDMVKKLTSEEVEMNRIKRDKAKQKFPGLNEIELEEEISYFTEHLDIDTFSIKKVSLTENTFRISRLNE